MTIGARESGEVETVTARHAAHDQGLIFALHVSSPSGSKRHLLSPGIVRLGRSAESQIVIDDPRASRVHAAVELGDQVWLSDLGSANGTYLENERLSSGEARVLAVGQSFFIGDSALVVRPTSLSHSVSCLSSLEALRGHVERLRSSASFDKPLALLRIVQTGAQPTRLLPAVLAENLRSSADWMLRSGQDRIVLGLEVTTAAEAPRLEREALQRLLAWGIGAEAEWRLSSWRDLVEDAGAALNAFHQRAPVALQRGKVVMLDPAMLAIERTIARVAPAPVNVLVLGETGAGKDVIASMIHELSPRLERAFVRLNCASLPEGLLESELFGHERGAFTGAVASKAGLLEVADGGTVFLDEVGDLPLPLQAKLLRVIESGEVQRVGSVRTHKVNVRFVAATNRDLARDVEEGRFRRDLLYRLNCVTLNLPPLRERPAEVEALALLFLEIACERFELPLRSFSSAALAALASYPFPGNVRELRNIVERAVLLTPGSIIDAPHLGVSASESPPAQGRVDTGVEYAAGAPGASSPGAERERIQAALLACGGNQSRAAKMIGIARRTLVRRMSSLGLPRPHGSRD